MVEMTTDVLVAYGSKRGSTKEIAEAIGETLGEMGLSVDVVPALHVDLISRYDAVVLGGALYMTRWHPDARRFGRRFARAMATRPVWLFSSGPLDHSAETKEIPPVRFVARLGERIGARGHATFGGRLAPDATGFPAAAMARKMAGDFRDFDQIRAWATEIGQALISSRSTVG
jgi:menaquinone-dependent protoporphyrinogen oxidase